MDLMLQLIDTFRHFTISRFYVKFYWEKMFQHGWTLSCYKCAFMRSHGMVTVKKSVEILCFEVIVTSDFTTDFLDL